MTAVPQSYITQELCFCQHDQYVQYSSPSISMLVSTTSTSPNAFQLLNLFISWASCQLWPPDYDRQVITINCKFFSLLINLQIIFIIIKLVKKNAHHTVPHAEVTPSNCFQNPKNLSFLVLNDKEKHDILSKCLLEKQSGIHFLKIKELINRPIIAAIQIISYERLKSSGRWANECSTMSNLFHNLLNGDVKNIDYGTARLRHAFARLSLTDRQAAQHMQPSPCFI